MCFIQSPLVEKPVLLGVTILPAVVSVPVNVPPASGSFVAIELVTVVEELASSPRAAASSFSVSKLPGAASTMLSIAVVTKAVVASLVVLLPAACVGAVGVPVSAGLASGA